MILKPSGEYSGRRVAFAGSLAGAGVWLGAAGLAVVAAGHFVAGFQPWGAAFTAVGAGLALAAAVVMTWRRSVALDFDARTVTRTLGWMLPSRVSRFEEVAAVAYSERERANLYGEPVAEHLLRITGPGWVERLLLAWNEREPLECAREISSRLGRPLEREGAASGPRFRRAIEVALQTTMWACAGAAALAILIPVVRGERRFRLVGQREAMRSRGSAYDRAAELYYGGSYKKAEDEFRKLASEFPTWPEAWNMLAYALADQNKLDEALKSAERAVDLAPYSGYIVDTLAEMHQRRKEYDLARPLYERALKAEPINQQAETRVKFAQTLIAMQRPGEAMRHLKAAIRLNSPRWSEQARNMYEFLRKDHPESDPAKDGGIGPRFRPAR